MAPQAQISIRRTTITPLGDLSEQFSIGSRCSKENPSATLITLTTETITTRGVTSAGALVPASTTSNSCFLSNFKYSENFHENLRSNYYSPGICPQSYTIGQSYTYDPNQSFPHTLEIGRDEVWAQCCPDGWTWTPNICIKSDPEELYPDRLVAPINIRWNLDTDIPTTINVASDISQVYLITTGTKANFADVATATADNPSNFTPPPSTSSRSSSRSDLSGGGIAGITIGLLLSLSLIAFIIFKIHQSHAKHEARKREIGARAVPTVPDQHRNHDDDGVAIPPPDYSFRPRNGEIPMEDLLAMTREAPDSVRDNGEIGDVERPRMSGGVLLGLDPAPDYTESVGEDIPRSTRGRTSHPARTNMGTQVIPNEPAPDYTESVDNLPGRNVGMEGGGLTSVLDTPEVLATPEVAHLPPRD